MIDGWHGQPTWLRVTALTFVALLAYGTVVHVVHVVQLLTGHENPYPHHPGWLTAYFLSLTALDPLAAVLLARCRRGGVALTVLVLVTDAVANALANYVYDDSVGVTAGRVGQAVITVLAVAAVMTGPAMWRTAARRDRTRQRSPAG